MDGCITTRQRCAICGGKLVHDEKMKGCFCKDHPQVGATKFIVRFPGDIYQRFSSYEKAAQHLNYLRHEKDTQKKKFNPDDYRSTNPNSFLVLKEKYLNRKKDRATYKKIESIINRAGDHFGLRNVREINGADIEDYLFSIPEISEKNSLQPHDSA